MLGSGGKPESFTYWKRPWQKWVVLAAAILQLLCLWMNVKEYYTLSGAGIFSAGEWARYAAKNGLQCAINGMAAAIFLGTFLIGALARSRRAARRAEGWLLLALALAWGTAGLLLRLAPPGASGVLWVLILLLTLGGGAYSLWKSRGG